MISEETTVATLIRAGLADADKKLAHPEAYHRHAQRFIDRWGRLKAKHLTSKMLDAYVAERIREGAAPRTVQHELSFISRCYRLGGSEGLVSQNPVMLAQKPRPYTQAGQLLAPEDETRLAEVMDPEALSVVAFALLTGLRPIELFSLLVAELDEIARTIRVQRPSGNVFPLVPLTRVAFQIATYWAGKGVGKWLFYADQHPFDPADRARTCKWFQRGPWSDAVKAAGLEPLRLRALRHTTASRMLNAGVNMATISRLLGHVVTNGKTDTEHLRSGLQTIGLYGLARPLEQAGILEGR